MQLSTMWKAILAGLGSLAVGLASTAEDGTITLSKFLALFAAALVVGAGVYAKSNKPA